MFSWIESCFSVFSITEEFAIAGVFIHPSKHSHLGCLDSECATRVYQIPQCFLYAYCCNLKAQNIQHICHGHFWTPQLKNYASLQRLVVRWGNPVDYKAVQPGALCSQGIPALFIVCFSFPRERLHIACVCVCFWTLISYFFVDRWRSKTG